MGYLTGKVNVRTSLDSKTDLRAGFNRFSPGALAANQPVVELVRAFATRKNCLPAQLSLAWLLAQKPFIVPIPGTRSLDHLRENLTATQVQLTPADLQELEMAFAKLQVHGRRMNKMQMQVVE